MSEIRKQKVNVKDIEAAITACEKMGLKVTSKDKNRISLTSSNRDFPSYISLDRQKDGNFQISADFDYRYGGSSRKTIKEMATSLETYYSQEMIIREAKNKGFTVAENNEDKNKIRIRIRKYSF